MCADGYLRELNIINTEIKRLNDHLKLLRNRKGAILTSIHTYMTQNGLDRIGEGDKVITLKKCEPKKPRLKAKPKAERKKEAIDMFIEAGIANPEKFWKQMELTQKYTSEEKKPEIKKKKKDAMFDTRL